MAAMRWGTLLAAGTAVLMLTRAGWAQASCYDGLHNGPESDVDCGGDCPPCDLDMRCAMARDCRTGLCVSGACQEQPYRKGDPVPTGYHLETSQHDAAASARFAGAIFFGIGYGGAYIGALSLPQDLSWLYAPVVGPWAALGRDNLGTALRAALIADGALQTAGALLLIGGIIGQGKQLVRGEMVEARRSRGPSLTVAPRVAERGCSFGVLGVF